MIPSSTNLQKIKERLEKEISKEKQTGTKESRPRNRGEKKMKEEEQRKQVRNF